MKLIGKSLISWSFLGLSVLSLEAKTLNLLLNQTACEKIFIEEKISEEAQGITTQFSVVNTGDQKLTDCLPCSNENRLWTLNNLAEKIAKEKYPLIALYQIWTESVVRSSTESHTQFSVSSPLDYLNFYGNCSSTEYEKQFIRLCHLLGIDTRQANVQGKQVYDFCLKGDDWTYLDISTGQFYLGWDNSTGISSENMMDDPLLVLRSKTHRGNAYNLVDAWQSLARLKIIDFVMEDNDDSFDMPVESNPIKGFQLYPEDKLIYQTELTGKDLNDRQVLIEHTLDWCKRQLDTEKTYESPFPILAIHNETTAAILIKNLDIVVEPGKSYAFDQATFKLNIEPNAVCSGHIRIDTFCNKKLFPSLKVGENSLRVASESPTTLQISYDLNELSDKGTSAKIMILNESTEFEYASPIFHLASAQNCPCELMHWQIGLDEEFNLVPFNLEGIQPFTSSLSLSLLDETFLNSQQTYYLRIRGCNNGSWSEWGIPVLFSVKKPEPVTLIEFDKVDEETYELNWEREAEILDGSIEYLIFGSNAFDFIPSIYTAKQINEIAENRAPIEENNDNLVAITTETKLLVDGRLAYYRIIARKHGQLSVPSAIIHVYDTDLIQPRTVLQMVEVEDKFVAKRMLFPSTYAWTETALPRLGVINRLYDNSLLELHSYVATIIDAAVSDAKKTTGYLRPRHVSRDLWETMKPYFLPENHPWKSKIDRIFSKSRASKNFDTLRKAGFKGRVTHVRKVFAGVHPECVECFFKIYCDTEMKYLEWQKWLDRIRGKDHVKEVIKKYHFDNWFAVPDKWCYPLPEKPEGPRPSAHYRPKDFILVCSNQRPYESNENAKMWKNKLTHKILDALYIILDEAGMWDSVFIFNIPFCKVNGKINFVDTEFSHKWPIRFEKLSKYLSSDNRKYWEYLIKHHGPKGYKNPNRHHN